MSKKDIVSGGQYMPTEVGSHIYVWSRDGMKPAPRERDCAISSHGVESLINRKIKRSSKPDNFVFYCPHGFNLQDPGILAVVRGKTKPNETVPVGDAKQDYVLTKYQGYHGSINRPETYKFIQVGMFPEVQRNEAELLLEQSKAEAEKFLRFGEGAMKGRLDEAEKAYKDFLNNIQDVNMDVVTVRNRSVSFRDMTLFRIVEELESHGFKYKDIHCVFCRGFSKGQSKNWSPNQN